MSARRSAPLLVALALAACFGPDIPDGQVPCGANGECPDGFECREVVGTCFHKGVGAADAALVIDGTPPADVPVVPDALIFDGQALDSPPPIDAMPFDAGPTGPVNVVFMGNGGGMVMLNGTMCISDCSPRFALGTVVQVTAQATGNSAFVSWGGACTGTGACQVNVDTAAGKTIEVTFNQTTQQAQVQIVTMGPGTVTVTPAGASCGASCFTFPKGTPVTLTPVANMGFSFNGWTGNNCEVVGVMPCMFAANATSTTVTARFCDFHHVVDATSGADANAGTCVAPFKTVTKALTVSKPDERVLVRPGVYQTLGGETFPLKVPDGVSLIGDEAGKGTGTSAVVRLEGGGGVENEPALRATVVLGSRSTLAGFLVIDPGTTPDSHGVVITKAGGAASAVVRNNTVTMCGGDGIYVDKGQGAVITGNVVTLQAAASGTGIRVTDTAAGAKLESNAVRLNSFGVEINAVADLGGGSQGSLGGNVFSCNTMTDLLVSGPAAAPITVPAQDNAWDHVPPTETCAGGGGDLCHQSAIVSASGATVAPSSCP